MRQYRYGTTTTQALKTLYREGGVFRFYRGVGPALIQALSDPMSHSRFLCCTSWVLLRESYCVGQE